MAQGFTTLGQQVMDNSEPVVIASDQSELPVAFRDSGNLDSFFRLRTSSPETLFDSKQISDKQPVFWDDQLVSGSGGASTYIVRGVNRGATPIQTNNNASIYPVIAMRLNSSYLHATVKPVNFSLICTSTSAYNWTLLLNPTVVGTAFTFSNVTNSAVDVDVARLNTTTLTGGTILAAGTSLQTNDGSATSNLPTDFALGSTIAGVSDIIVLAVQRVTGTSETFYGSLNWREQV